MFQDGDKEIEYLVNSEGVKLNKGVSYVALSRFQTRFANVGWSDKGGVLSIVEDRR